MFVVESLPGGGKLEAQLFGKPRQRPGRGPVEPAPTPQWKLERDHPLPAPGMRGIQVTPRLNCIYPLLTTSGGSGKICASNGTVW